MSQLNRLKELKKLKKLLTNISKEAHEVNKRLYTATYQPTFDDHVYVQSFLLKIITSEFELKKPELDEEGIPYCKRKKSYPDWAEYIATDACGDVYIYERKPSLPKQSLDGEWLDHKESKFFYIKNKKRPKDFTKTLRRIRDKE